MRLGEQARWVATYENGTSENNFKMWLACEDDGEYVRLRYAGKQNYCLLNHAPNCTPPSLMLKCFEL